MVVSSPTKNALTRIYEKTRLRPDMAAEKAALKKDRCLLNYGPIEITEILKSDRIFFVGERRIADLVLGAPFVFESMYKKLWVNGRNIFEFNQVIYFHKDKPRLGRT